MENDRDARNRSARTTERTRRRKLSRALLLDSAGSCNSISRECRMRPCPAKQIHREFQSSVIFRVRGHIGFRAILLDAVSLKMVTQWCLAGDLGAKALYPT